MSSAQWDRYANFSKAEFDCKHTGLNEMQHEFMMVLQKIRDVYGQPMKVTSGYRHPTHPVEARKQRSDGEHTQGMCANSGNFICWLMDWGILILALGVASLVGVSDERIRHVTACKSQQSH